MTKNIIILLIYLVVCTISTIAQTEYYNDKKTFYENGYTYQCDIPGSGLITLYNKTNQWTYTFYTYKGTSLNYIMKDDTDLIEDDTWTRTKRFAIVNNAFSVAEKLRVKGYELTISMYIDTDTGKVTEVNFGFLYDDPFATIPLSVYRKIELDLKKEIWYTPTAEGKKLNYILYWWGQEPK